MQIDTPIITKAKDPEKIKTIKSENCNTDDFVL
jgi:hypothetical protein